MPHRDAGTAPSVPLLNIMPNIETIDGNAVHPSTSYDFSTSSYLNDLNSNLRHNKPLRVASCKRSRPSNIISVASALSSSSASSSPSRNNFLFDSGDEDDFLSRPPPPSSCFDPQPFDSDLLSYLDFTERSMQDPHQQDVDSGIPISETALEAAAATANVRPPSKHIVSREGVKAGGEDTHHAVLASATVSVSASPRALSSSQHSLSDSTDFFEASSLSASSSSASSWAIATSSSSFAYSQDSHSSRGSSHSGNHDPLPPSFSSFYDDSSQSESPGRHQHIQSHRQPPSTPPLNDPRVDKSKGRALSARLDRNNVHAPNSAEAASRPPTRFFLSSLLASPFSSMLFLLLGFFSLQAGKDLLLKRYFSSTKDYHR